GRSMGNVDCRFIEGFLSLRCYRSAMAVLNDEHGKQRVDAVTNDWIQDLFNELSNAGLAATSKCNRWAVWYMFFDHLDTLDLIAMPKLLRRHFVLTQILSFGGASITSENNMLTLQGDSPILQHPLRGIVSQG